MTTGEKTLVGMLIGLAVLLVAGLGLGLLGLVFWQTVRQRSGPTEVALPDVPVAHVPLDIAAEVTVLVKTGQGAGAGNIRQLIVRKGSDEVEVADLAGLTRHLQAIRPGLANPEDIKVIADGRLKYDQVVKVMDACKSAGFDKVSLGAPPELDR